MRTWRCAGCGLLALGAVACSSGGRDGSADSSPTGPTHLDPGTQVALTLSSTAQAEKEAIDAALEGTTKLTAGEFAAKYNPPFTAKLGYDPLAARGLDLIQSSPLQMNEAEKARYSANGFVISANRTFPTFAHGYTTIYMADLPVYVSADSILEAVHRSYDTILKTIETVSLIPELERMLGGMRARLAEGPSDRAAADADVYLAVALSLLDGMPRPPVLGGDAKLIGDLYSAAKAHRGELEIVLFGVKRDEDFSQFTPRGHYTDTPELTRYFQSMMWLGRTDFRMIETQKDGTQLFRRRQLEAAVRLHELLGTETRASWTRIDAAIHAFVGEADYMTVPQMDGLLRDLGASSLADLKTVPDQTIAQAIVDGRYGTQRISSHIMETGLRSGTLPLSSSFALMGQRYAIDSHVFSNVVFDRIRNNGDERFMPDPLDAAFAALDNDQAGQLLTDQLVRYKYAPDLAAMRVLADSHGDSFWHDNLYNLWLSALRELSPGPDLANPMMAGLSSGLTTEAWGRRLLNTQLASWAELRHDTILYVKQSYSSRPVCEFPDAYVDPYPGFYQAVRQYADRGAALVASLAVADANLGNRLQQYFATLAGVSDTLKGMADAERQGTPFTAEQMAFINQAVKMGGVCGVTTFDGWYAQLYFDVSSGAEYDPTIADVHTDPNSSRVLHVGTGMPRAMVVSVDVCGGPRAYVGLASSYYEQVEGDYKRLDDPTWAQRVTQNPPNDVRWVNDLVAR